MKTPNGYKEMIKVFGDLEANITPTGKPTSSWEYLIGVIKLPLPVPSSWDENQLITRLRVHKLLEPVFIDVFDTIYQNGYWNEIKDIGGAYIVRKKKSNKEWSTHSWGIAVDINVKDNPMGWAPQQNDFIVKVFEDAGFEWGGRWKYPDGMHFQFVYNY